MFTDQAVTLVTPTGSRSEAFALCRKYVARQNYEGAMQWLIVDDSVLSLNDPDVVSRLTIDNPRITVECIKPPHHWTPGSGDTLALNLKAAIPHIMHDVVLFIEDDDWYGRDYVKSMMSAFAEYPDAELVGDPNSMYYHVTTHRWRYMQNKGHVSLCQTGLRRSGYGRLFQVCARPDIIDWRLWNSPLKKKFLPVGNVIGIKGLPGRSGIGIGHRPERNPELWNDDTSYEALERFVGPDVMNYRQ